MQGNGSDFDEEQESAFSIERAWSAVRRRAHIVGIVSGTIICVAFLIISILPTRYEGVATVQVDPRRNAGTNINGQSSGTGGDIGTGDSEIETIGSRTVINRVIDELGLRTDTELVQGGPIRALVRFLAATKSSVFGENPDDHARTVDPIGSLIAGVPAPALSQGPDEIAIEFTDRLAVNRVRMTQSFEIRYSSADPVKAATIANAVAKAYLNDQIDRKQRDAGLAIGLLEPKLIEIRTRVADAEGRVEKFKAENNIYETGKGEVMSDQQLALTMQEQIAARNATAAARAKLEQVKKLIANGESGANMADILESGTVMQRKDAYAVAMRRKAELESKYGPKHPALQKAEIELRETAAQLNVEIQRYAVKLHNDYEVAAERESQLREGMSGFKEQHIVAKQANIKLQELEREAATEKQIFEALLTRYKQTSETQSLQLPDSRIVEAAEIPVIPSAPKRMKLMLFSILLGLGAGIGAALALEFLNTGISRPEDVEQSLALSHLSSLPVIEPDDPRQSDKARPARLVLAEPNSLFADAVRGVRREIDLKRRGNAPRIIMIASGLPGEGSEIIASNLAHHYAMTGHRILLVDGDLRRWNLTRRLGVPHKGGLLEVLANGLPVGSAILRDTVTGLHFLPACGPMPLDTSSPELLTSARMADTLAELKRQFDTIVIDTPPLLPVIDGRIIADHADQIVFVVNWRRTPMQLSKRAIKGLGENQDKIAGVVVNQVDAGVLEDARGYGSISGFNGPSKLHRAA